MQGRQVRKVWEAAGHEAVRSAAVRQRGEAGGGAERWKLQGRQMREEVTTSRRTMQGTNYRDGFCGNDHETILETSARSLKRKKHAQESDAPHKGRNHVRAHDFAKPEARRRFDAWARRQKRGYVATRLRGEW